MSHTIGPWRLFSDVCPFSHDLFRIKSSDGETGIAVANGPCANETALANARLIAAAPDLLLVLQEFVANSYEQDAGGGDYVVTTCEARERAIDAIAKALGES
jgi:hypothetical protein